LRKGGAERLVIDICKFSALQPNLEVRLLFFDGDNEFQEECNLFYVKQVKVSYEISLLRKNKIDVKELQEQINIFLPHVINTHLYAAEFVSRLCEAKKSKWFSHVHGFAPQYKKGNKIKKRIIYAYERWLISKGDPIVFIAVSNGIKEFLQKYFITKRRIEVLLNAIEVEKFTNLQKRTLNKKDIRLISVGNLVENKNHLFLIEVMKKLKQKEFSFSLSIVGSGVLEEKIFTKINQENLPIFLEGKQSDVSSYLKKSDIYVHCAKKEAFGLTILEAMASGLPVVTLNGVGNSVLIKQGENGYLIKDEEVNLFVEAIMNCICSDHVYKKMSDKSVQMAKKYSINNYILNLQTIYFS
jgi:glycosyltransferase EpsD